MKYPPLSGNHVFGRDTCPFSLRAKKDLEDAHILFTYHNVLENNVMEEMKARVQPLLDKNARITVPQIWLEGTYIGGSDALREYLKIEEEDESPPFCPL